VRGDEALAPWYEALLDVLPPLRPFDAHTHVGANDPDGFRLDRERLLKALEPLAGHAVVFPANEPDGDYAAANATVLADAAASAGRLVPFCRLDPRRDPVAEASRCVEAGARGIKLHPRAERFDLELAPVADIFAFAERRRLPILIHCGGGIPPLAGQLLDLVRRFPAVPVILAHAAVNDFNRLWQEIPRYPNVFFDTSWWNAADLVALFALIPPGRVLYASDAPYETPLQNAVTTLRCALHAGVEPECLASVMGGQLERLLAGEPPADLGPAPGARRMTFSVLLQRVYADLVCAVAEMRIGDSGYEGLTLARRACEDAQGIEEEPVLRSVLSLLELHQRYLDRDPLEPDVAHAPGYPLIATAAAVALTPGVPLPAGTPCAR
jgi:hypothetical protein